MFGGKVVLAAPLGKIYNRAIWRSIYSCAFQVTNTGFAMICRLSKIRLAKNRRRSNLVKTCQEKRRGVCASKQILAPHRRSRYPNEPEGEITASIS